MSKRNDYILSSPIEYLKGVGPQRAEMLQKELGIFTFKDLLEHFPYRHIDKTVVTPIDSITPDTDWVQIAGKLISCDVLGDKRAKRLMAEVADATGTLELVWFQGVTWIQKTLTVGQNYLVYGKVSYFNGKPQISHPELEPFAPEMKDGRNFLEPVYPSTEKLKSRGLGGRQIAKLTYTLFTHLREADVPENLPAGIVSMLGLVPRFRAFSAIHFPQSPAGYEEAVKRLKFEELFIAQLRMGLVKLQRHRYSKGVVFGQVGELFNSFYSHHLPFELTGAQKNVIREIRKDFGTGRQMNRLLQGDVGSGKTIVALLCMLLAADNGFQSCLMAPTEILARQHFQSISNLLKELPVNIGLLTGTVKSAERKKVLNELREGTMDFLVGTHAVIEDTVEFKNLGLAVADEQHRFGVAQRAKLWTKAVIPPHVLGDDCDTDSPNACDDRLR